MARAYVGDIGTIIEVNTFIDLTDAVTLELKIKKPSGAEMVKTAVIPDGMTAADGKISYTTEAGDFDVAGVYYLQPHIEGASTDHLGNTSSFEVFAPYDGK